MIRPALPEDAAAVAEVWLRSFAAALPTVRRAHSDDEVRGWVRDVLLPQHDAWVADVEGRVLGLLALSDGRIDQLYLDPEWRGRGLGDRFVALAKQRQPAGLELWTFQVNEPARRFYERHGFLEAERTNGAGNEESEPDVRYFWRPEARWLGVPSPASRASATASAREATCSLDRHADTWLRTVLSERNGLRRASRGGVGPGSGARRPRPPEPGVLSSRAHGIGGARCGNLLGAAVARLTGGRRAGCSAAW